MICTLIHYDTKSMLVPASPAHNGCKFLNIVDHTAIPVLMPRFCRACGQENALRPARDGTTLPDNLAIGCPQGWALQQKPADNSRLHHRCV